MGDLDDSFDMECNEKEKLSEDSFDMECNANEKASEDSFDMECNANEKASEDSFDIEYKENEKASEDSFDIEYKENEQASEDSFDMPCNRAGSASTDSMDLEFSEGSRASSGVSHDDAGSNDSFFAPVNGNVITPPSVSPSSSERFHNNDTDLICGLLESVMSSGKYVQGDVERAAVLATRMAGRDEREAIDFFVTCLYQTMDIPIDTSSAGDKSVLVVFDFVVQVAFTANISGTDALFHAIFSVVDYLKVCTQSHVRCRVGHILTFVMRTFTRYSAEEDDTEDEINSSMSSRCAPSGTVHRVASALANLRIDKSAEVRAVAIQAFACFPLNEETYADAMGDVFSPHRAVAQALLDVDLDVRTVAALNLYISDASVIDRCLDLLAMEEVEKVRLMIARRLIADVHPTVFTVDSRMRFLSLLQQDPSSKLTALVGARLLPRWLQACKDHWSVPGGGESESHPFLLLKLEFVDFTKNEESVLRLINLAIQFYAKQLTGSSTDMMSLLNHLKDMTPQQKNVYGVMDAFTLESNVNERKNLLKELCQKIFFHRAFIECICGLYARSRDYGERDRLITRLLPNMMALAEMTRKFSKRSVKARYCEGIEDEMERQHREFCIRTLFGFIRAVDRSCLSGRKSWYEALTYIVSSTKMTPSMELVEFCVTELLEYYCNEAQMYREVSDWACYTIGELMTPSSNDDADADIEQNSQSDTDVQQDVLQRCAVILHSILRFAPIEKMSTLLRSITERLIPVLLISPIEATRCVLARIVGLGACIDPYTRDFHSAYLRHLLTMDVIAVKLEAFLAIGDIIITHGFKIASKSTFPEDAVKPNSQTLLETNLRELIEGFVDEVARDPELNVHLPNVLVSCLRVINCGRTNWPTLFGKALFYSFDKKRPENLRNGIRTFLGEYCSKGFDHKMRLLAAFFVCVDKAISEHAPGSLPFPVATMVTLCAPYWNGPALAITKGKRGGRNSKLSLKIKTEPLDEDSQESLGPSTAADSQDDAADEVASESLRPCVPFMLVFGLLHRVSKHHRSDFVDTLCNALPACHIDEIVSLHLASLLQMAERVNREMERYSGVKQKFICRFITSVEKVVRKRRHEALLESVAQPLNIVRVKREVESSQEDEAWIPAKRSRADDDEASEVRRFSRTNRGPATSTSTFARTIDLGSEIITIDSSSDDDNF